MIQRIISTQIYSSNVNLALFILRLGAGIFMLTHGWGKMLKLIGDAPITFSDPLGIGVTMSLSLAVFSEVFCSFLLIFGLLTRLAAVPLLITMLVAAFIAHAGDGFAKQEKALLYGLLFLVIAIVGAGKYSMDCLIESKLKRRKG